MAMIPRHFPYRPDSDEPLHPAGWIVVALVVLVILGVVGAAVVKLIGAL